MDQAPSTAEHSAESKSTADKDERKTIGFQGEEKAAEYLLSLGYHLIERNWSCRVGELDIICFDPEPQAIVFVEVKSRLATPQATRHLFDTIGFNKQKKLRILSEIYLRSRPSLQPGPYNRFGIKKIRIDAIGIILEPRAYNKLLNLKHIKGAV